MGANNPLRPVYRDLDWGEAPPPEYTVIQRKLDGHWAEVRVGRNQVSVMSRSGRLQTTHDVRTRGISCTLIGEHMVGTPESVTSDQRGQIVVFDVFAPRDAATYTDRMEMAEWIVKRLRFGRLTTGWQDCGSLREAMASASRYDWEGLIFRNPDAPYFDPIYRMVRRGR